MSIRDTSAQDRIIEKRVSRKKLVIFAGIAADLALRPSIAAA